MPKNIEPIQKEAFIEKGSKHVNKAVEKSKTSENKVHDSAKDKNVKLNKTKSHHQHAGVTKLPSLYEDGSKESSKSQSDKSHKASFYQEEDNYWKFLLKSKLTENRSFRGFRLQEREICFKNMGKFMKNIGRYFIPVTCQSNSGSLYKCVECSYTTKFPSSVLTKKHITSHKCNEKTFKCSKCKFTSFVDEIIEHSKLVHNIKLTNFQILHGNKHCSTSIKKLGSSKPHSTKGTNVNHKNHATGKDKLKRYFVKHTATTNSVQNCDDVNQMSNASDTNTATTNSIHNNDKDNEVSNSSKKDPATANNIRNNDNVNEEANSSVKDTANTNKIQSNDNVNQVSNSIDKDTATTNSVQNIDSVSQDSNFIDKDASIISNIQNNENVDQVSKDTATANSVQIKDNGIEVPTSSNKDAATAKNIQSNDNVDQVSSSKDTATTDSIQITDYVRQVPNSSDKDSASIKSILINDHVNKVPQFSDKGTAAASDIPSNKSVNSKNSNFREIENEHDYTAGSEIDPNNTRSDISSETLGNIDLPLVSTTSDSSEVNISSNEIDALPMLEKVTPTDNKTYLGTRDKGKASLVKPKQISVLNKQLDSHYTKFVTYYNVGDRELILHMKKTCSFCNSVFKTCKELSFHVKNDHHIKGELNPHHRINQYLSTLRKCPHCTYLGADRLTLYKHCLSRHFREPPSMSELYKTFYAISKNLVERTCNFCGYIAKNGQAVLTHSRSCEDLMKEWCKVFKNKTNSMMPNQKSQEDKKADSTQQVGENEGHNLRGDRIISLLQNSNKKNSPNQITMKDLLSKSPSNNKTVEQTINAAGKNVNIDTLKDSLSKVLTKSCSNNIDHKLAINSRYKNVFKVLATFTMDELQSTVKPEEKIQNISYKDTAVKVKPNIDVRKDLFDNSFQKDGAIIPKIHTCSSKVENTGGSVLLSRLNELAKSVSKAVESPVNKIQSLEQSIQKFLTSETSDSCKTTEKTIEVEENTLKYIRHTLSKSKTDGITDEENTLKYIRPTTLCDSKTDKIIGEVLSKKTMEIYSADTDDNQMSAPLTKHLTSTIDLKSTPKMSVDLVVDDRNQETSTIENKSLKENQTNKDLDISNVTSKKLPCSKELKEKYYKEKLQKKFIDSINKSSKDLEPKCADLNCEKSDVNLKGKSSSLSGNTAKIVGAKPALNKDKFNKKATPQIKVNDKKKKQSSLELSDKKATKTCELETKETTEIINIQIINEDIEPERDLCSKTSKANYYLCKICKNFGSKLYAEYLDHTKKCKSTTKQHHSSYFYCQNCNFRTLYRWVYTEHKKSCLKVVKIIEKSPSNSSKIPKTSKTKSPQKNQNLKPIDNEKKCKETTKEIMKIQIVNDKTKSDTEVDIEVDDEKIYVCSICAKRYKQYKEFQLHKRKCPLIKDIPHEKCSLEQNQKCNSKNNNKVVISDKSWENNSLENVQKEKIQDEKFILNCDKDFASDKNEKRKFLENVQKEQCTSKQGQTSNSENEKNVSFNKNCNNDSLENVVQKEKCTTKQDQESSLKLYRDVTSALQNVQREQCTSKQDQTSNSKKDKDLLSDKNWKFYSLENVFVCNICKQYKSEKVVHILNHLISSHSSTQEDLILANPEKVQSDNSLQTGCDSDMDLEDLPGDQSVETATNLPEDQSVEITTKEVKSFIIEHDNNLYKEIQNLTGSSSFGSIELPSMKTEITDSVDESYNNLDQILTIKDIKTEMTTTLILPSSPTLNKQLTSPIKEPSGGPLENIKRITRSREDEDKLERSTEKEASFSEWNNIDNKNKRGNHTRSTSFRTDEPAKSVRKLRRSKSLESDPKKTDETPLQTEFTAVTIDDFRPLSDCEMENVNDPLSIDSDIDIEKIEDILGVSRSIKMLTCTICAYTTESNTDLRDHKLKHSVNKKEHNLRSANKELDKKTPKVRKLSKSSSLEDDSENEIIKSNELVCELCKYVAKTKKSLKIHIEATHINGGFESSDEEAPVLKNIKEYDPTCNQYAIEFRTCQICDYVAGSRGGLSNHLIKCHNISKISPNDKKNVENISEESKINAKNTDKNTSSVDKIIQDKKTLEKKSEGSVNKKEKSQISTKNRNTTYISNFNERSEESIVKINKNEKSKISTKTPNKISSNVNKIIKDQKNAENRNEKSIEKNNIETNKIYFEKTIVIPLTKLSSLSLEVQKKENKTSFFDSLSELLKARTCKMCGWIARTKGGLSYHIGKIHNGKYDQPLAAKEDCDKCPFQASSKERLLVHHRMVHAATYYCDKCNFNAKDKNMVTMHEESAHGDGTTVWNKRYNLDSAPVDNNEKIHININQVKVYQNTNYGVQIKKSNVNDVNIDSQVSNIPRSSLKCRICSFKALDQVTLEDHVFGHENGLHPCNMCSFMTKEAWNLERHKSQMHNTVAKDKTEESKKRQRSESSETSKSDESEQSEKKRSKTSSDNAKTHGSKHRESLSSTNKQNKTTSQKKTSNKSKEIDSDESDLDDLLKELSDNEVSIKKEPEDLDEVQENKKETEREGKKSQTTQRKETEIKEEPLDYEETPARDDFDLEDLEKEIALKQEPNLDDLDLENLLGHIEIDNKATSSSNKGVKRKEVSSKNVSVPKKTSNSNKRRKDDKSKSKNDVHKSNKKKTSLKKQNDTSDKTTVILKCPYCAYTTTKRQALETHFDTNHVD